MSDKKMREKFEVLMRDTDKVITGSDDPYPARLVREDGVIKRAQHVVASNVTVIRGCV